MEHLAIMAIILEEPQNRRRQRRWSVQPLWKNRSQQGEFQIYNTLIDHEDCYVRNRDLRLMIDLIDFAT